MPNQFAVTIDAKQYPLFLRYGKKIKGKKIKRVAFPVGSGWSSLLHDICKVGEAECLRLKKLGAPESLWPKTAQVKEKFGGLRYYVYNASKKLHKEIVDAESKSETMCDICSSPSVISGENWVTTTCPTCRESLKKRAEKETQARDINLEIKKSTALKLIDTLSNHYSGVYKVSRIVAITTLERLFSNKYTWTTQSSVLEALDTKNKAVVADLKVVLRKCNRHPNKFSGRFLLLKAVYP